MYTSLEHYPIHETLAASSKILANLRHQLKQLLPSRTKRATLCLDDFITPFHHLRQDERYHIYGYILKEIHGTYGSVAAIEKDMPHSADVTSSFPIATLDLHPHAIDPMEIIYCDGSPEGYLEAILYQKLLTTFPQTFNVYSDANTILFEAPNGLYRKNKWDMLISVDQWAPKCKDNTIYLYMYELEDGFEASNGLSRISLRSYAFSDNLDFIYYTATTPKQYPAHLDGRSRYGKGKHCCVFGSQQIVIGEVLPHQRTADYYINPQDNSNRT